MYLYVRFELLSRTVFLLAADSLFTLPGVILQKDLGLMASSKRNKHGKEGIESDICVFVYIVGHILIKILCLVI